MSQRLHAPPHFFFFYITLLVLGVLSTSYVYAGTPVTKTRGETAALSWTVTNAQSCFPSYVGTQYPDNSTVSSNTDTLFNQWSQTTGPSGTITSVVWGNTDQPFPQSYTFKCREASSGAFDTTILTVNDCPSTSSWNSTSHTCVNPAATVTISPASNQALQLGSSTTFTSLASDTGADITGHNFNWLRPGGNAGTSSDWNWGNANPQNFYGTTNVAPNPSVAATASDSRTITFTPNTAGVYTVSFSVLDNGSSRWTSTATYTLSVCAADEYVQGSACVKIPVATLAVNQSNGRQITWTCTDATSVALSQNGSQVYTKTFSGTDSGNYTMLPGKTYSAVCTNSYGRASVAATYTSPSLIVANGTTDGRLATYTWSCPSPATAATINRVNGTTTISSTGLATSGTVTNNNVALGTTYDYALVCTNGATYTGTVDAASLTTPTPISLLVTSPSAVAPTDTATITWTSDGTVCQLENYNRTQILKSGITKVGGYFTVALSATSTPSLPQSYGAYGYYVKCSDGTAPNRMSTDENLSLALDDKKAIVTVTGATIAVVDVAPASPTQLTWQCTNADRATLTQTLNGVTTTVFSSKVLPPNSGTYTAYPGASYDLSCTNTPNPPAQAHYDPPTLTATAPSASQIQLTFNCVDINAQSMILSRTPGWTADASSTVSTINFTDTTTISGSTNYTYTLRCYDGPVVGGAQSGTLIGYTTKSVTTPAAVCTNGATNPTTCNVCPSNLVWDGASCVTPSADPTVSLSVNPTSVISGGSATLSWGSQNATGGCTASGDWSGAKGTSGTASTGAITDTAKIYTLTCSGGLGSNPVSTSVSVTIQPNATGGLTASSCTIASGASTCSTSVTWETDNTVDTITVRDENGVSFVTNGASTGTTAKSISYGSHLFALKDGDTLLDTATYSAGCALGTQWINGACAVPASPTGILTPASCAISAGQSTCLVNVAWETSDTVSSITLYDENNAPFVTNGQETGSVTKTITHGSHAFTLYDSATLLGSTSFIADCALGSLWNGTVCQLTIAATGNLFPASCTITSGQSTCAANIVWETQNATNTVSITRDYAGDSLVISSNGPSNGGTYNAIFDAPGNYPMTMKHNGVTLGNATYSVGCELGTQWINGACSVPLVVTGILTPTSCTIASRASSCALNIVWSTQNATTTVSVTRDYDAGSLVTSSTGASNGGTYAVTFNAAGTYSMSLRYAGNTLGESALYDVRCVSGTTWNGSICAPPAATGTLTPDSCTIAIGQASCAMTVSWGTANAIGPVAVTRTYDNNTTISGGTGTSGTVAVSFPSGSYTLALMDENKTVTLDSRAYIASCANNSTWNGTLCERNSAVFGVEAYITETGVGAGTYSLSPASPLTTDGSFGQWSYRTTGSDITNCVMHQQNDSGGWYGGYDTDAVGFTKTYASYTSLEKNDFANAFDVAHDWRVTCYGGNNQSSSVIWSLIATSTPEIVVEYTCNNGAENPTACDVCPNGQTIGTTATGTPNVCVPICANGAGNPVACTATCPDGSIPNAEGNCAGVCPAGEQLIDGVCGVVPSECTNGAINFSACDICSPGDYYSTSDNACHTPVCGNSILETGEECDGTAGINDATRQSCGAATSATACTISCTNGATDAPNCGACPAGKILISGTCVNMCNNGAVQSSAPACTACPVGKLYRNGFCIFPICGNGILEGNEVCDKQAGSYNHTTYQCNDICQTEPFGTLPEAEDDGIIPSIRVTCPNSDKYEIIRGSTGAVVAGGTYTVPVTYTPTVADTYKMSCIKVVTNSSGAPVEVKSTPVLRSITAAVFTPNVVSLNATPKTVQKGSPVTLTWDIANPNELCTIIATPIVDASCGFICSLMRNNDSSRLTGTLAGTKTDVNDPYGNGDGTGRPMRDALSKVLTNDGHARGKKTIQVNYSTTFTASCGTNALQDTKRQEVKVQVATSNEG